MSNQLLFEPRRPRVWAAKALAVLVLAGLVAAAVVLAAFWAGAGRLAEPRDITVPPASPGPRSCDLSAARRGSRSALARPAAATR